LGYQEDYMKTLHEAAEKALAVLDSFALHTPEILSGPDYEIATELRSALGAELKQAVAWRKKGTDGFWHLYYQNVGWKDCSGFEPLYPHPAPPPVPTTRLLTAAEKTELRLAGVTGEFVRVLVRPCCTHDTRGYSN
jgi:hypothetical protein